MFHGWLFSSIMLLTAVLKQGIIMSAKSRHWIYESESEVVFLTLDWDPVGLGTPIEIGQGVVVPFRS